MSDLSRYRGIPITCDKGVWCYIDTGEPVEITHETRSCGFCGLFTPATGIDPCLKRIPGAMNACCGHGDVADAYIQREDTTCLRGACALLAMEPFCAVVVDGVYAWARVKLDPRPKNKT